VGINKNVGKYKKNMKRRNLKKITETTRNLEFIIVESMIKTPVIIIIIIIITHTSIIWASEFKNSRSIVNYSHARSAVQIQVSSWQQRWMCSAQTAHSVAHVHHPVPVQPVAGLGQLAPVTCGTPPVHSGGH
jgi:hypothetical protein